MEINIVCCCGEVAQLASLQGQTRTWSRCSQKPALRSPIANRLYHEDVRPSRWYRTCHNICHNLFNIPGNVHKQLDLLTSHKKVTESSDAEFETVCHSQHFDMMRSENNWQ